MTNDNALLVDAASISHHWDNKENFKKNCIEMFRQAFQGAVFCSDPLQMGVVAIATQAKGEDKDWLDWQAKVIKQASAWLEALQAGLDVKPPGDSEDEKRLKRSYTLMELFHEGKRLAGVEQ